MISDWRHEWGIGDFPFLYVQISNFKSNDAENWAEVRERLSKVPVVHGTDLELMTRREVRLRIKIRADDNLLHVALAQQDLTLTPGKPYDILQLRGGAP